MERYDLLLMIDLIEHIESHLTFLREVHRRAQHFILHIPLDLSVRNLLRAGALERGWDTWGHLHQFTAGLALKTMDEAAYEVMDKFYTSKRFDNPPAAPSVRLLQPWKKLLYRIAPDSAVQLMGGFSLMVLAK